MATAEHWEPRESRGSCTVLGAPGGASPSGDSSISSIPRCSRYVRLAANFGNVSSGFPHTSAHRRLRALALRAHDSPDQNKLAQTPTQESKTDAAPVHGRPTPGACHKRSSHLATRSRIAPANAVGNDDFVDRRVIIHRARRSTVKPQRPRGPGSRRPRRGYRNPAICLHAPQKMLTPQRLPRYPAPARYPLSTRCGSQLALNAIQLLPPGLTQRYRIAFAHPH
jgi:hypothetical protein